MSWIDTSFEIAMKTYFISEIGETKGEELFTDYTSIRNTMESDNFFREIKGQEPSLSDHSEKHIQDVFDRTFKLIGDTNFRDLAVSEVYCLALMILFHDVGNIYGRNGHESIEKIADVYNQYRQNFKNYREEKRLITLGASAHSGNSQNGSKDTLKFVKEGSLKGNKIRLPELSSILRFADELAEGKQRTCSFLIEKELLDDESEIYHKYAEITDIEIDRNLNRISITYHIDIPKDFNEDAQTEFKELMLFTYYRAIKLDIERRYTKYYSNILKPFNFVTVQYNFSIDEIPIELDLGKIIFEDQYPIPGQSFIYDSTNAEKLFIEKNQDFDFAKIIEKINSILK